MSTTGELLGGRQHSHPHDSGQPDRRERATSIGPTDSLVLDIGGEVGAVVVHLAARPPGGELEACPISPTGRRGALFHTGVHRRLLDQSVAWTAVFPEVAAGTYHLLDPVHPDGAPLAQVAVTGGTVHQLDLR